jgi:hypothetical protein
MSYLDSAFRAVRVIHDADDRAMALAAIAVAQARMGDFGTAVQTASNP